jgi:FeS assembly SUF system regulator
MLRISKLTDYAILVMVELCMAGGTVLSAQAMGQRLGLESPTVSKVLKLLARAGLVQSRRGANGGYSVDRDAGNISVAEIIAAIEGPIAMTECSVEVGLCSQEDNCGLRGNWQRISSAVAAALERVSLAEMSRPASRETPVLNIATFNS